MFMLKDLKTVFVQGGFNFISPVVDDPAADKERVFRHEILYKGGERDDHIGNNIGDYKAVSRSALFAKRHIAYDISRIDSISVFADPV